MVCGERSVIVGAAVPFVIGSCTVFGPALRLRVDGTIGVSCDDDTSVVDRVDPLKRTCAPVTKFAPLTIIVNDVDPATTEVGSMERMTGVVAASAEAATKRKGRTTTHARRIRTNNNRGRRLI